MALLNAITKLSYQIGWIALLLAFVFRALTAIGYGAKFIQSSTMLPRNILQISMLLFLICAASHAYAAALAGKEQPAKASSAAAGR